MIFVPSELKCETICFVIDLLSLIDWELGNPNSWAIHVFQFKEISETYCFNNFLSSIYSFCETTIEIWGLVDQFFKNLIIASFSAFCWSFYYTFLTVSSSLSFSHFPFLKKCYYYFIFIFNMFPQILIKTFLIC